MHGWPEASHVDYLMMDASHLEPVDYLVVGHVAIDITPRGSVLGGTAAYAGLSAQAFGLRVGVVTSGGPDLDLSSLDHLILWNLPAGQTTTFENHDTKQGRIQILHELAAPLQPAIIPTPWRSTSLIHLGPIADELAPALIDHFPGATLCLTPQGWLRAWDANGKIHARSWRRIAPYLPRLDAVVLSLEDLSGDREAGREMAKLCRIVVVTEGADGARVYWDEQERHFPAPQTKVRDTTGAGDIFAASFFIHYHQTQDPWSAARLATLLTAISVSRYGVQGTPTADEVHAAQKQVIS